MFLFFQPLGYVYCNCGTREKEDLQIECECTMDKSGKTRIPSAICHTKCRYRLCSGFKLSFSKIVIINGRSSTFYTDERVRLNQSVLVDTLVTTELIIFLLIRARFFCYFVTIPQFLLPYVSPSSLSQITWPKAY